MTKTPAPQVALVIVAQGAYDNWEALTEVPKVARELAQALGASGYQVQLPELINGGTRTEVIDSLDVWLQGLSEHDRLVLYWVGHGTGAGVHYLVMKDSPRPATPARSFPTRDLGELIAQSKVEKVLLILDTCFSSGGAEGIAQDIYQALNGKTDIPGQVRYAAVLPSVNALQRAQEGLFCRALIRVLIAPVSEGRTWTDQDEHIGVSELGSALLSALRNELGATWQPSRPFTIGWDDRFLPNPRYRGQRPAADVETGRRVTEDVGLAFRSGDIGEAAIYFTGRTRLLEELATWLRDGTGLVVLTGSPGTGKSAVLGRLMSLSNVEPGSPRVDREGDAPAESSTPSTGRVDAAVHARGMTTVDLAHDLSRQMAIDLPRAAHFESAKFVATVSELRSPVTVVVDALDEAREPRSIAGLLVELVRDANAKVLVGSRLSPDGQPASLSEHRHKNLQTLFGENAKIVDLDDEVSTPADIASYVSLRLRQDPASRHQHDEDGITRASAAIATKAEGVFLYARVVTRTMLGAGTISTSDLPAGPLEAFTNDLESRFGADRGRVDAMLSALAWGEGGGLSRWAWPRVATALAPAGTTYDERDVAWVLDRAGSHVLMAGQQGQTVYRLAHQSFADYYRTQVAGEVDAHQAILEQLTREPTTS